MFSAKGAVVTNIAHIPAALTAVMRANGARAGLRARRHAWRSSPGSAPTPGLDAAARARPAGGGGGRALQRAGRGARAGRSARVLPRQTMKDASGASQMDAEDPGHQPARRLDARRGAVPARRRTSAWRCCTSRAARTTARWSAWRSAPTSTCTATRRWRRRRRRARPATRRTPCWPRRPAIVGPRRAERARAALRAADRALRRGRAAATRWTRQLRHRAGRASRPPAGLFTAERPDPQAEAMLAGLEARGARSVFVALAAEPGRASDRRRRCWRRSPTTLAWGPLMRKRVSRLTAESLPWWMQLFGALIGASVEAARHEAGRFCGIADGGDAAAALADRGRLRRAARRRAERRPTCSPSRPWSACCCRTARARSRRRARRARSPPTGPEQPGARAAQQGAWSASSPIPATRTAATATRASPS